MTCISFSSVQTQDCINDYLYHVKHGAVPCPVLFMDISG